MAEEEITAAKVVERRLVQRSKAFWLVVAALAVYSAPLFGQDFVWTQASAPSNNWASIASSSDGTKLVAAAYPGRIFTSTNSGLTWQQTSAPITNYLPVASSSDGTKLVAAVNSGGGIYTSTNSGLTWTKTSAPIRNWQSVASSSDGTKLVALDFYPGGIYTSTNSGLTWTQTVAPSGESWFSWIDVASSSDGTKLVAVVSQVMVSNVFAADSGRIYTSTNSGLTWTQTSAPSNTWVSVASSSDGTKLAAAVAELVVVTSNTVVIPSRGIYTSTNSGFTWTQTSAPSNNWASIASSSDGTKLVAAAYPGRIFTSTNSGLTWKQASAPSNTWVSIASSSNGSKLAAVALYGGIYTAIPNYLLVHVDGELPAGTNVFGRGPVTITLETSFPNGIIVYSLDGSDPRSSATLYTGPFAVGESALLRAVAYNSAFTDWVEMEPVQITILPTLTANTAGGGTVNIDPPSGPYFPNSIAQITAQPASGCTFLQWLGDASGTNPTTTVTMNRDKYVEAVFATAVGTVVVGGGSIFSDPSLPLYPFGTTVKFTAQPGTGNHFAQWGAAASGTNNPLNFVVSTATPSIAGVFSTLGSGKYALTVIENGRGHVARNPLANVYNGGQSVTNTAIPEPGQDFIEWSGDAGGSNNPQVVTMNSNKTITANFTTRPSLRVGTCLEGSIEDSFRLTLTGEFGGQYLILGSTNLLDWSPAGTVTNAYGTTQFTDPAATNLPVRFYRALSL